MHPYAQIKVFYDLFLDLEMAILVSSIYIKYE